MKMDLPATCWQMPAFCRQVPYPRVTHCVDSFDHLKNPNAVREKFQKSCLGRLHGTGNYQEQGVRRRMSTFPSANSAGRGGSLRKLPPLLPLPARLFFLLFREASRLAHCRLVAYSPSANGTPAAMLRLICSILFTSASFSFSASRARLRK